MIIPQWICKKCECINPEQVHNLRKNQGTYLIITISCTCAGCGKQATVSGLKETDEKVEISKEKKRR